MTLRRLMAGMVLAALTPSVWAQVQVKDAWMRAPVAAQKAAGAYMQLTAEKNMRVVAVTSPVAGIAEIHEMSMDNNMMRMRAVNALELPAGKTVELKPGGYHLMLMDLKQAIKEGDTVPVTLVLEGGDGKKTNLDVKIPVRSTAAPAHDMTHKH